MSGRDPFAEYRARLATLGFRPSRRLGQNFLLAPELHRLIADASGVGRDDVALEIGAGLGFLTRELALRAGAVLAVEIDARLCTLLQDELQAMPDGTRVTLVPGDALAGSHLAPAVLAAVAAARAAHPRGELRVAANLPYAVTGPLLAALVTDLEPIPIKMSLLVQAEVGDRLRAAPGTAAYGSLSVLMQSCYRVEQARRVGREVFRPRPNVDSAVLVFERLARGLPARPPAERRAFASFVRALFSGRRRKMRHGWDRAVAAAGLAPAGQPPPAPDMRPSETDPAQFLALWDRARGES